MLPKQAVKALGRRVLWLGIIILVLSAAGYWFPLVSIFVVALAILGAKGSPSVQRFREDGMPFYFSKKNHGLMILGIIPDFHRPARWI